MKKKIIYIVLITLIFAICIWLFIEAVGHCHSYFLAYNEVAEPYFLKRGIEWVFFSIGLIIVLVCSSILFLMNWLRVNINSEQKVTKEEKRNQKKQAKREKLQKKLNELNDN